MAIDSVTLATPSTSVTLTRPATAGGTESRAPVRIEIPTESEFDRAELDFLPADDLEELGRHLRATKPQLNGISGYAIQYLWKRKGGSSGGRSVLGKCLKTPPMVKTFKVSTWTVWLAADHCREFNLDDHQFEALLFHELLHAHLSEVEVTDRRTGETTTEYRPTVIGHELEMFHAEVAEYGLWTSELKRAQDTFAQAELPGINAVPFGGAA